MVRRSLFFSCGRSSPQMHFKKRLLCLLSTVILIVPYYYIYNLNSTVIGPPYVEGWNHNTSKNVSDYISETLLPIIMPKKFCKQEALLLVIVNIRPDSFEARSAIRETWAQRSDNASFYFLIGEDKNHHFETQLRLKQESELYNDIIQERFIDSYNNLTLKSINMLKLFTRYCSKSHKYLMKIDDDVFLNVHNVLEMLAQRNTERGLLTGKLINDTKPFRDPTSKWYVPYELYPEETYPPYLCGPMYLISSDVAEKLYRCTLETPIFFIEDVYITGLCAKKINITPQHHSMITCEWMKKYVCLHRNIYSLHHYDPGEMRTSYKMLKENTCPSSGSLQELIFSLFYK